MKWIVIAIYLLLFLLISFFGLGPVLLADGTMQERVLTLAIVLLLYVAISISGKILLKKLK